MEKEGCCTDDLVEELKQQVNQENLTNKVNRYQNNSTYNRHKGDSRMVDQVNKLYAENICYQKAMIEFLME